MIGYGPPASRRPSQSPVIASTSLSSAQAPRVSALRSVVAVAAQRGNLDTVEDRLQVGFGSDILRLVEIAASSARGTCCSARMGRPRVDPRNDRRLRSVNEAATGVANTPARRGEAVGDSLTDPQDPIACEYLSCLPSCPSLAAPARRAPPCSLGHGLIRAARRSPRASARTSRSRTACTRSWCSSPSRTTRQISRSGRSKTAAAARSRAGRFLRSRRTLLSLFPSESGRQS